MMKYIEMVNGFLDPAVNYCRQKNSWKKEPKGPSLPEIEPRTTNDYHLTMSKVVSNLKCFIFVFYFKIWNPVTLKCFDLLETYEVSCKSA